MSKVKSILIAFVLLLFQTAAFAVPAKPGLITMKQADGTEIKVRIIGDERSHYYLSEDNFPLIDENGMFYYGNVDAQGNIFKSEMKAEPVGKRSASAIQFLGTVNKEKVISAVEKRSSDARRNSPLRNPGLFDYSFPVKGDVKGLVVLVQYKDVKFKTSYNAADYFKRMMNERGFSDYGGTGCVEEYFEAQSKGVFRPHFDVYGPITLSQNMSYYGGNDWSGNDQYAWKMPIEACQQLDAEVDFSEYDTNHDGYIDNIFVFYAGGGEATGGGSNTVWPHSWNISEATYGSNYTFDGVILDRYACSNEWESGKPDGVGTFIHEFSHVMGLPDLYATSYTSAFTPGAWSVMDYGPYNNDGRTPPAYSVYERYSLDWIKPQVLDGPNTVSLSHIENSNQGCIIKTDKENEYFLLENRQQEGWDKYIPSHGMLVWHIDFNESVWASNSVNNTSSHQYVDLEEADGSQNEYSRDGDAFPGTSKKTSFTDDTKPSMKTWAGKKLGLPITNITETGGKIRFDIAGGRPDIPDPVAVEPLGIGAEGFKAAWKEYEGAEKYFLSVYTKEGEGDKQSRSYIYNHRDVSEEMEAEGDDLLTCMVGNLQPATQYYYEVTINDGEWDSNPSNEIAVMTTGPSFEHFTPKALPVTDITDNGFTINWEKLDEAEKYEVTLFEVFRGDPEESVCDFTGGLSNLPEGWVTNSKLTYANDAYSGEAKPALRLSTADSYITSPLDGRVDYLEFWHRGSNAPEANRLNVYATEDGKTWQLITNFPINNAAGGETLTVDSLPYHTRAVKIEYQMNEPKGAVAIDDIKIGRYMSYSMPIRDDFTVSAEEEKDGLFSLAVSGLKSYSWYSFKIEGINNEDVYSHSTAYNYVMTAKATQKPDNPEETSKYDINGDGKVNIADVNLTIDAMHGDSVDGEPDVNGDGKVNIADLNLVIDAMSER